MDQVRIGFIGCGGMARHHFSLFSKIPEAKIVAIADPAAANISIAKSQFDFLADVREYSDYPSMLADGGLDAVHINTPHTQHRDQILYSLRAGLHVLCEKPLVTNVEDAHIVIEAAKQSGKICGIGYQRHTEAKYVKLKEILDTGKYGKVTLVSAFLGQEWKRLTAGTWRQNPELSGGGQLNDSGSHMLDILLHTTGLEAESVSAYIDNRGTPVDIDSTLSIRFKGGALGTITIVGDAPGWIEDISICCEKAAFYLRGEKLSVHQADGVRYTFDQLPQRTNQDKNFVDAILGREAIAAPFDCGLRVISLTEAAWKSGAADGKAILCD